MWINMCYVHYMYMGDKKSSLWSGCFVSYPKRSKLFQLNIPKPKLVFFINPLTTGVCGSERGNFLNITDVLAVFVFFILCICIFVFRICSCIWRTPDSRCVWEQRRKNPKCYWFPARRAGWRPSPKPRADKFTIFSSILKISFHCSQIPDGIFLQPLRHKIAFHADSSE